MSMLRRVVATAALLAVAVVATAGSALALPGTLKISALRARSVAAAEGAALSRLGAPPPPPRAFESPTKKGLPHTGPAVPTPLTTGAGITLTLLGGAGLGLLRRTRRVRRR